LPRRNEEGGSLTSLTLKHGDCLVIATHNKGKVREFEDLCAPIGVNVVSSAALGLPEPEETGTTFAENASLKAVATAVATGKIALADDSGLAVDALDGAPGIYSARWAGESRDFGAAMRKVEAELVARGATAPEARRARFVCVLCLANPAGEVQFFEGTVAGHLVWPPRGTNGFGYDPMFVADGRDLTFGEMDPAAKHAISHRANAFAAFKAALVSPL
jgi:XTP/dITP diphosphohydrolase